MPRPAFVLGALFARLASLHPAIVALFLFASSAIEHVFPPYPGDLAVAAAAAVVFARGWFVPLFLGASVLGATAGSVATFYLGRWLHARGEHSTNPRVVRLREQVREASATLDRRGVPAIVLSRFVPVGRAVVISAAGYAGMAAARAIPAAVASAVLWDGALFALGAVVGHNRARIEALLQSYNRVAGVVLLALALAWVGYRVIKRRSARA